MDQAEKLAILNKVETWFQEVIVPRHIANTEKLANIRSLDINPFLVPYLAGFLEGQLSPKALAKAIVYPRVLGTSITTSFGQNLQNFITTVLGSYGSLVQGIDVEFTDALDQQDKFCQLKLGPNTINKDDVQTIHQHFRAARNLGKTNNRRVQQHDMVVGVMFGEPGQENNHYRALRDTHDYTLLVGREFWLHLTGDAHFYQDLQSRIGAVAVSAAGKKTLEDVIERLAATEEVKRLAGQ